MIKHYPEIQNIEKQSDNQVTIDFIVTPEYEGFEGHFSDQGIFPGVGQIDLAIKSASEQFGLDKYQFKDISQVKFMRIIFPNDNLKLQLDFDGDLLVFKYFVDGQMASQGKIKYATQ